MASLFNSVTKQAFEPFYLPCHLHRQVGNDLPEQDSLVQRAYKVVIPLLMLYQPITRPLSLGMGALRVVTHLVGCNQARQKGEGWQLAAETTLAGLGTISLVSFYSYFPRGLFLTTVADLMINLGKMIYYYREQKFDRFTEEFVQVLSTWPAC
jgi:hypothetical protein